MKLSKNARLLIKVYVILAVLIAAEITVLYHIHKGLL